MSYLLRRILILVLCGVLSAPAVYAGNPDRAGEAGAYELLILGWARNSGLYGMTSASVSGLEAMRINPAGLAHTRKTEVMFARTHWLQGSELFVNAAGLAQKFGKDQQNVVGVSINALSFGEIERTTTANPNGGLGTFTPSFFNLGLAYSRAFSNSIFAGVVVRLVNERIDDLSATGVALDAGLQYVTGPRDNIKFGIALRNIGTPMKFSGDGLSNRVNAPDADYLLTQDQRAENFELPSQLHIGAGYDWHIDNAKEIPRHVLSFVAQFTSNSFGKDQFGGGIEYGFRKMFMVRAGYRYEDGINNIETRTGAHTGFAAGMSIEVPFKKNDPNSPSLGIDYSYRTSSPFGGTHTYGVRFNL